MVPLQVAIVLSLVASSYGETMTCMAALQALDDKSACPKQCNEDSADGDTPQCTPGQKERDASKCNVKTCTDHFAALTDAKITSIMAGIKECAKSEATAAYAAYAEMGEDYFKMSFKRTAEMCGQQVAFTLAANTCGGAMYGMNFDAPCPKACNNDNAEDGLPKCGVGQKERSASTCGAKTCGDFLASKDDAALATMVEGLLDCKKNANTAPYAAWATGGADGLKNVVNSIAQECGHPAPFSIPLDTCMGAVSAMNMESVCPRACSKDKAEDGLLQCKEGEEERNPTTCGMKNCKDYLASKTDAEMSSMFKGLKECAKNEATKMYAVYTSYGEGYLKQMMIGIGEQCGHETSLTLNPKTCAGAMSYISIDNACPKQCGDQDSCQPGQEEYSLATCGKATCRKKIAEMTDAVADSMMAGLADCSNNEATKPYAEYAKFGVNGFKTHYNNIAEMCGATTAFTLKRVKMELKLAGMDFDKFNKDGSSKHALKEKIVASVLKSLPAGYQKEYISIKFSKGSVKATVSITPADNSDEATLSAAVKAKKTEISNAALADAKALPNVANILEANVKVADLTVTSTEPTVEAVSTPSTTDSATAGAEGSSGSLPVMLMSLIVAFMA